MPVSLLPIFANHYMPSAGLLALLDDITSLLDDVATMTKVASSKTAAVVGDDLALNANQLLGTAAARELPVIGAVAKGSLINKAILVPAAILITVLIPFLVKPLLMIGGAFLCFEGTEKVLHKVFSKKGTSHPNTKAICEDPSEMEATRIKGAIRTDFILSAEILIIALGAAAGATISVQIITLCIIGLGMTILVYGMVALIVKADDLGIFLQQLDGTTVANRVGRLLGRCIIISAPRLMKLLSFLGTAAMFLVGGEIITHGIPLLDYKLTEFVALVTSIAWENSGATKVMLNAVAILAVGFLVGLSIVMVAGIVRRIRAARSGVEGS